MVLLATISGQAFLAWRVSWVLQAFFQAFFFCFLLVFFWVCLFLVLLFVVVVVFLCVVVVVPSTRRAFRQKSLANNLEGGDFCLQKSTCKGVNWGVVHTFSSSLSIKTKWLLQPHILNHILKELVVEGLFYWFLVKILPQNISHGQTDHCLLEMQKMR